jgi:hypothetical protein
VARKNVVAEVAYMSLANEYLKNPRSVFFREIGREDELRQGYLKMLKDHGVVSYALAPVYFNNSLAGVLEIYSKQKNILNESVLARLEPVMPLLSQMLKNSIDEFNGTIDHVVKEHFTSSTFSTMEI